MSNKTTITRDNVGGCFFGTNSDRGSKRRESGIVELAGRGKVRLTKWYSPYSQKERNKATAETLNPFPPNSGLKLKGAYYILDEILIAGELQETSKKTVARLIAAQFELA
ncbi:AP complex subunit sigma [Forsythia ovata]|uniref:AP complex subunit sigma n=1 Tax=Forsythia ovata TaxID=205694 RepID=A0ABD1UZB4_9LAMI